ncbi:hypothetical protein HTY51_07940 [Rhodoferax sp. BAB1]|nr:hypothetical protein HTY51_07940 [Rhodoferax sp. BAB1]
MPGYLLTTASQIRCTHGGTATLTTMNAKVKVESALALLESDVHVVAGCPFTLPGPKPSPCVRIEWTAGATMCKVDNISVLVQTSVGRCISAEGSTQGMAIVSPMQTRAQAT